MSIEPTGIWVLEEFLKALNEWFPIVFWSNEHDAAKDSRQLDLSRFRIREYVPKPEPGGVVTDLFIRFCRGQ